MTVLSSAGVECSRCKFEPSLSGCEIAIAISALKPSLFKGGEARRKPLAPLKREGSATRALQHLIRLFHRVGFEIEF